MANQSEAKRKSIIFMSDGKVTCVGEDTVTYTQKTLDEVRALNTKKTAINAVGICYDAVEHFLKSLTQQNQGKYRRLRN